MNQKKKKFFQLAAEQGADSGTPSGAATCLQSRDSLGVNHFQLSDQFLMGLIDGDGTFSICFKAGARLSFIFHITGR